MALPAVSSQTPTSIGQIDIHLHDRDGTTENRGIEATVHVLDQNGQDVREWRWVGRLEPHLTQAQINGILSFLDNIRAQAEAELIP